MMQSYRAAVVSAVGIGCLVVGMAGCRTSVQKIQMERVDQEPGGNRGFFLGNAPPPASRKPTREIAELQVEMDAKRVRTARGRRPETPSAQEEIAPMTVAPTEETAAESYTVQKGDTLWSIARKVYGNGNQWPRIFDVNRDQLSEPGRLHTGMVLRIPGNGETPAAATYEK